MSRRIFCNRGHKGLNTKRQIQNKGSSNIVVAAVVNVVVAVATVVVDVEVVVVVVVSAAIVVGFGVGFGVIVWVSPQKKS